MGGNSIEAVVFDLDGTLIDSAPDLLTAVNRMLAEQGRRGLGLGAVTAMVGDGVHKLVERALAATGDGATAAGEIAR
ncbi:MAG: HAD hydrolase-like protein, partial [Proteobacteria bacterium]|nr:HAD hydrolase-like protein [Pseudomonadota bacterium]